MLDRVPAHSSADTDSNRRPELMLSPIACNVPHEYGVAALFVVAIGLFCVSLIDLARETRIALHDFDHHQ